ncbi:hypothetical protein HO173_000460 [Letharia columbiana]|uniref:Uncharacterized protein n=1 Tax=Letharia columbiana TaxID=112416 RepID=A0A8H6G6Y5_9LECA|nr:uncharacterized protein HO173_000460 [Letharia columbiana]KAF6241748.1 hypothetical protein HO173_000460 [Letharia columbiana]
MAGVGEECFTLPAVTTSNYTPKVAACDVFGFHPSISQGAELLADAVVSMPDFLQGGLPLDAHPADTEEKRSILMHFIKTEQTRHGIQRSFLISKGSRGEMA